MIIEFIDFHYWVQIKYFFKSRVWFVKQTNDSELFTGLMETVDWDGISHQSYV